jgi:hypothetical protein
MALKFKITKEEYDALDPLIQAEYKGDGAGYVLDTDVQNQDTAALVAAHTRVKEELRVQREQEAERLRQAEERIRQELRDSGNTTELERRLTEERESLRREKDVVIDRRTQQLSRVLVQDRAAALARELSGDAWLVMLPHIQSRLVADLDSDVPACKVIAADGQPSTLTIEDLKKEFLNNSAFASIIKGVDSSGGGAGRKNGGNASKKPEEYSQQERIDLFNTNRAEYDRLFPVKN